jgi:hypothetical protein
MQLRNFFAVDVSNAWPRKFAHIVFCLRCIIAILGFIVFLESTMPSSVIVAYTALAKLAHVKSVHNEEEFVPIVKHLVNSIFWPSALTLIYSFV